MEMLFLCDRWLESLPNFYPGWRPDPTAKPIGQELKMKIQYLSPKKKNSLLF
jgi:hypothetical protein